MSGTRKRRLILVGVAVLLLALLALALGLLTGGSKAQTDSESTVESEQQALPEQPTDSKPGAPVESGGEPFRTCVVCHPDYESQPGPTEDLIFSHKKHLDANVACATCHPTPLGHFGQPAPLMVTCLSCHQGETAPNDCKNCHRKLDEIAPGVDEPVVHLKPDARTRRTCEKCHDVGTWCEQCHGVVMPHPTAWPKIHGRYAESQPKDCVKCHQSKDKNFCVRCHGLEMPHPAYWYSNHGDIAAANPDACTLCHTEGQSFCNDCHHAGFSPTDG